ncbi:MAG TPA: 5-formyltetrahydrofolate cyclo-ligase [Stellaceae bacterium]|jgi:5-formyltetrahydrofolate cyclo-ligase|nr:5-formyltetrahydrofolate cyclo-ligase [Stellaceae bacterium]
MDDDHIEKWRRQERRRLLAERLTVRPEQHRRWSAAIESRLSPLLNGLPGTVIGLYWPVRAEFDARPLAAGLRERGRMTALPAVIERGGRLEYRIWEGDAEVIEGLYGIPVPKERWLANPGIVVVPVVGFDAANYRLGYGGGYFDRTLAALEPRPLAVGVGFEAARLETVFPRSHDIAMDIVVTEACLQRKTGAEQ